MGEGVEAKDEKPRYGRGRVKKIVKDILFLMTPVYMPWLLYRDLFASNVPYSSCFRFRDGEQKLLSIIYFVSYMIMINLIIINMYIAVILENFNQAQSQDEVMLPQTW